ncbi:MAG: fumarylacetoacetate hydrolase family protein [Oligoflexia bacterium]|nr:fumarylacetoacetate hydrolase family protein [Oligoflexia bacterium]
MKLVTFELSTPLGVVRRLGAYKDNKIIDLQHCFANLISQRGVLKPYSYARFHIPSQMIKFIQNGEMALNHAQEALDWFKQSKKSVGKNSEKLSFNLNEVRLLAPLPRPRSLRDFMAFEEHTKAGWAKRNAPVPQEWYEMPVYYKGSCDSIIGPDDEVLWPSYTQKLDYELELAAVIGKKGKDISAKNAKDYIYGFTIMNDFSARDIQAKEMICRLGPAKGKDFATALGPWLVTIDEVGNFEDLEMSAKINGKLWSKGNSGSRYWSFGQMIEHVSKDEFIFPGDVFGSGTVGGGCGLELDKWVKPGDVIELEISKLGVLKNTIGQRS